MRFLAFQHKYVNFTTIFLEVIKINIIVWYQCFINNQLDNYSLHMILLYILFSLTIYASRWFLMIGVYDVLAYYKFSFSICSSIDYMLLNQNIFNLQVTTVIYIYYNIHGVVHSRGNCFLILVLVWFNKRIYIKQLIFKLILSSLSHQGKKNILNFKFCKITKYTSYHDNFNVSQSKILLLISQLK